MSNNTSDCLCSDCWDPRPIVNLGDWKYFILIILSTAVVITIFGNLLVICAVLKYEALRTKITNYFIINLAITDFLVGFCLMPFAMVQDFGSGVWPFGHYCLLWFSLDVCLSTVSIYNLLLISIERYIAVTRPFQYHEIITKKVALIMIITAWIIAAGISFGPILSEAYQIEGEQSFYITAVQPDTPFCKPSMKPAYAIASSMCSFYVPFVVLLVLYIRVLQIARRHARQIADMDKAQANFGGGGGAKKNNNKATKTIALVLLIFFICWMPFFLINLFITVDTAMFLCVPGVLDLFLSFVWLGWLNSMCNVFIYSINPQFRRAYKRFLCCGLIPDNSQDIYTAHTS